MPPERRSVGHGTLMKGPTKMAEARPAPPTTTATAPDRISVELSSRRTGMSFQRTRMSADRTLMSVIRTALALIGFGFTIFQFFERLREAGALSGAHAARNFGLTLVALGIGMLVLGIGYHVQFMLGLRHLRQEMTAQGLIHGESQFPVSLTLIIAVVLLLVGIAAIVSMVFDTGPF
jgi:putative membrane protein